MSLKERLMDDLKTSMKEKQTLRKNTITMLRSRIKQYEVDNRLTADDDLIMQMIQKEIKERNDTLDSLKGTDRAELIKDTEEEISYLSEYLPKQMDDDELNDLVSAVVAEVGATSMKDMGAVMKLAKERSESRVDAKRLSEAVKAKLGSLK
ncbi:aspartyl-tRNA amidotransferase [Tissierellia bacterium S7-1-4]|uniref:GatB/YqeY domain-containing protein n=1 Tax=Ezakiella coagulans TaxID=46507 RepID=UPI00050FEB8D|nr:GatB/YqeY domain-containing protein [Ezakiella coagulans]KGF07808.1 aspartyl-tRNA amidotransferase [Tissierellia bacterium S7-1-4]UQK60913.1 GatB/YqeY domain-containing protein [Ezakiella coagulans]